VFVFGLWRPVPHQHIGSRGRLAGIRSNVRIRETLNELRDGIRMESSQILDNLVEDPISWNELNGSGV